tara:strand:+ start:410 stop:625 length:216 start_codon:yes stop_codon:yes gene_type:complete
MKITTKKWILYRCIFEPLFSLGLATIIYFSAWLALSFLGLEFLSHNWEIWRTLVIIVFFWGVFCPIDLNRA